MPRKMNSFFFKITLNYEIYPENTNKQRTSQPVERGNVLGMCLCCGKSPVWPWKCKQKRVKIRKYSPKILSQSHNSLLLSHVSLSPTSWTQSNSHTSIRNENFIELSLIHLSIFHLTRNTFRLTSANFVTYEYVMS